VHTKCHTLLPTTSIYNIPFYEANPCRLGGVTIILTLGITRFFGRCRVVSSFVRRINSYSISISASSSCLRIVLSSSGISVVSVMELHWEMISGDARKVVLLLLLVDDACDFFGVFTVARRFGLLVVFSVGATMFRLLTCGMEKAFVDNSSVSQSVSHSVSQ